MFRIYGKRFSFTLVEVIVVCSMIAAMVIGIILAINRAFIFMENTKLAIRATNLAREGVEMMYNIRDTNRRKFSGKKDYSWLYFKETDNYNESRPFYVLHEDADGHVYAENINKVFGANIDEFYSVKGFFSGAFSIQRNQAKLDFTGTYSYYSGGSIATGNLEDLLEVNGVNFYRIVRVYGVYCKLGTDANQLVEGEFCKNKSDPKEMRFCVKVFYENRGYHASELCSIMTNFME